MERVYSNEELNENVQESASFSITESVSDGWSLMNKNFGIVIGGGVLIALISIVLSQFTYGVTNAIFGDALIGGVFVIAHKSASDKYAVFSDLFEGFNQFGILVLGSLFKSVLIWGILVIMGIAAFIFADGIDLSRQIFNGKIEDVVNSPEFFIDTISAIIPVIFIGSTLIFLVSSLYTFFTPLVMIHKMKTWQALETSRKLVLKNFFPVIGLLIMVMLINILGLMALFIGVIFTMPLSYFMIYSALRQMIPMIDENSGTKLEDHLVE